MTKHSRDVLALVHVVNADNSITVNCGYLYCALKRSRTMAMQSVNPDVQKERNGATFSVESLTNLLDGGEDATRTRREIIARALKDPVFTAGPPSCFLPREELYDRSVEKAVHMKKLTDEWKLAMLERQWLMMVAFPNEPSPDGFHTDMFVPTLEIQATTEQKKLWLPKAATREYMGTYSQSEMGHGTHLRGLETTATYDPKTEEFVLHSPTTSSMKWWPGGQGKTTNCAVVMAQLYSQGKNHGIRLFFVIFRDLNTHQPMPGVAVGDVGPKMGFNTIDNGFLKFDHFRIPRENMLMKHAEVLKDGTFVLKTKQKKPAYSIMTVIRTIMVRGQGFQALASAMTIAIRYSAVRRQSELQPGAPEPQILDYQTQQYKLFPYLAMAYAFKFASDRLLSLCIEGMGEIQGGNDTLMPELHALSSGLKAYCTGHANLGMEEGRRSCGGHGYSEASGFPKLYTFNTAGATLEGDNTVLLLQATRYLIKCVDKAQRDEKLAPSVTYLADKTPDTCTIDDRFTLEGFSDAFEHRARRVIFDAAAAVKRDIARGLPLHDARNNCGVFLIPAAVAHCESYVVKNFAEAIKAIENPAIVKVMTQLCQLLGCYHIVNQSGDFLEDGFMSRAQLQLVREKETALLAEIRPNAVALVDAFDLPDIFLGSVLGRYDGHVYDNLYKWALESPLNKTQVHESYYKYLQPMMKSKI